MSENNSFYDLRGSCVHFSQSGEKEDKYRSEFVNCISSHTSNCSTTLKLKSPCQGTQPCQEDSKRMFKWLFP